MRLIRRLLLVGFISVAASPAVAVEIAYKFRGTVVSVTGAPWQVPITNFAPVTGAFIYDSASPSTHDIGECDCLGYRQQRLNGFFAKFGNVSVRADDYVVEVRNDVPFNENDDADIVAVSFQSDYVPALELPLIVESAPRTAGLFTVTFAAPTSLFATPALPSSLSFSSFHTKLGFLSDTVEGAFDVAFSITSLTELDLVVGDYDLDNDVDASDYHKWKSLFGSSGELAADGNRDGIVDAADYTVWRNALNPVMSFDALLHFSIVPEPSLGAQLLIGLFWLASSSRRKSRSLFRAQ